jgi:hypothetical protein
MRPDNKPSRRQGAAQRQADRDLEALLDNPAGRRVLMRLIDGTGVFLRSFTGNSETFYREGRRAVGLDLVEHIERVRPGSFANLQVEALALRTQLEQIDQRDGEGGDE